MIDTDSLKAARKAAGLNQTELAKRIGAAQQLIGQLERGEVKTTKLIFKLAEALDVAPWTLDSEIPYPIYTKRPIPVVGHVGIGAEIVDIDNSSRGGGIDEIVPPFDGLDPSTVAVRVRGNSMAPAYKDGEILLYDRQNGDDLVQLIGKDCVVSLADGRKLVKQIRRTPGGEWFLQSVNSDSEPIFGIEIEWAAKVKVVLKA